jgi:hypothetical protein
MFDALHIDDIPPTQIGPGCYRRDLPSTPGVRVWVVDIDPGCEWPHIDQHDAMGEEVYVVSGAVIEGLRIFGAGTYLLFKPNSSHRPRSVIGARLFGFNLTPMANPTASL